MPVTGLNRSCLATALGSYGKKNGKAEPEVKGKRYPRPRGKRGGRPVKYGEKFAKTLSAIRDDCGKPLAPMIRGIIDFLAGPKEPDYRITEEDRKLLMEASAAEAGILLKPAREALEIKGANTARAVQTPLRSQIPVRAHFDRDAVKPGMFAFDTVARCGGPASGRFCKTLAGADVYSGRVEGRSLLNVADCWVKTAISDIQGSLPFPMTGAHYDNGMEFVN